jgi:type IV pilus assembly protein PilY1
MNNPTRGIAAYIVNHITLHFLIALSLIFTCPLFASAECSSSLADYSAIPPFLSSGVEGNLLLVLDNSGSMYDLAYIDDQDYCYDDNYSTANVYAGYFDRDAWYYYDQTATKDQFEPRAGDWSSLSLSDEWTAAAGTGYYNDDIHIRVDSDNVTAFFAKGNFLNWATASKLDIQKKILTGGKYEATGTYGAPNGRLVMESRGCLDRRFVKQVPVLEGGVTYYLTLGIRPPHEETFPPWENGSDYPADYTVTYYEELYRTKNAITASSTPPDLDTVNWEFYTPFIRWTNGTTYPPNKIISDGGKMYITATGGTASGTGVADDAGITDWVSYNVTHIEIFSITETGFDHTACELAIEELGEENPNQGQLKQYIDDCMGYTTGGGQTMSAEFQAAFNHAIHNCWYMAKHSIWPPGAGPVESVMASCEKTYTDWVTDPWTITPDDRGYVCFGVYNSDPLDPIGYIGRCWKPGLNATCECTKYHPQHPGDDNWCQKWECSSVTDPGWDAGGYDSVEECVETALQDYCSMIEIPEVIDPSDQASETNLFWNIPAVLIDSGVVAQNGGGPIALFRGYIKQDEVPAGLIQEFSDDLRVGAMIFNDYGSDSECNETDPYITYNCSEPGNRDGGKIISYIDRGETHTDDLVSAINDIKATTWTPIAEAMYTAIGYYTQNDTLKLDPDDFLMDDNHTDPVQFWCQTNNILIITEGASTTDKNQELIDFIDLLTEDDGDVDLADCGSLDGSTYLDDLTYYAKYGDIYPEGNKQINDEDKQNITTHIVVAGSLRSTELGDECSPDILLENAALNGGTSLYNPADPAELETTLRTVFSAIRAGAATGSAASVISASRAGEGAIYQAIFFPKYYDGLGNEVNWWGEVHALFLDDYGMMHEDTNENNTFEISVDRIVEFDEETGLAELYDYDSETGAKTLEAVVDILDIKFIWDTTSWLSDPDMNVTTQRTYTSNDSQRYIFTDYIDTGADVSIDNVDSANVMDFTTDFVNDPDHDNYYFLNPAIPGVDMTEDEMIIEAQKIIRFVRGEEGLSETKTFTPYRNRTLTIDDNNKVYRLGDIIYSTPTVVSKPSENYDLLYRDDSYRVFRKKYLNRRIVVYAGANDGMLHAFNSGFYDPGDHKFNTQPNIWDSNSSSFIPDSSYTDYALGTELWAYVPNSLLPHLKWLKESLDGNATHVYYVDLKPRIFDARIFYQEDGVTPLDADHPGGWGTVLVGGMRLGGGQIGVDTTTDVNGDPSPDGICDLNFQSTYFALDITNPEVAPNLLWSFSDDNLGFTTCYSTPIRVGSKWFVVIGSGPLDYEATRKDDGVNLTEYGGSNRTASLYILNADDGTLAKEFPGDGHSFLADPIAVDFDLATTVDGNGDLLWTGEAIYIASDGCGA